MKKMLKKSLMRRVMKRRIANTVFDDAAGETWTAPADAGPEINNSHYFSSHDLEGNSFFLRAAKRGGKNGVAEVWFAFKSSSGEIYVNTQQLLPLEKNTTKVECIEPLRKWKISFEGKVIPVIPGEDKQAITNGKEIDAKFEGEFTSEFGIYDFSRDTDLNAFCNAIAAEKWKKGFSDELKKNHQVHIEQDGHATATLSVEGKEFKMDAPAIRDHSFGRRLWSYMNRHAWLSTILEDKNAINVNTVRYPALNVFGLKTGYKIKNGVAANMICVDFPKDFLTSGKPPTAGEFKAKFSDKTKAVVKYEPEIIFTFNFDDADGGYVVYEGIASFTVDNVKGRGIAEFGYNKDRRRYADI